MPETIALTIKPTDVRGRDTIVGVASTLDGEFRSVDNSTGVHVRKIGPKWATFRDADDKLILRVETDRAVIVHRTQQTQAERDVERREFRVDSITRWLDRSERGFHSAVATFSERLIAGEYRNNGEYYDAVLSAEALRNITRQILHFMDVNEGMDAADAFDRWAEMATEQLMGQYSHRALSRSSSVMSNLCEDVALEAIAKTLNDWSLKAF